MSPRSVTLTDSQTGGQADVLVDLGFNCYRWKAIVEGSPLEVLWAEPEFESGARRPSGSGIPVLFPFPGRIRGTRLDYQGSSYLLDTDDGRGNAIHGFVFNRPWRVVDQSAHHVTGEFQASVDDAQLLERWPADFRVSMTYLLEGNVLAVRVAVENPGQSPLPFGLGLHPYLRVPIGSQDESACRVVVPAATRWELADMLPTGKRTPVDAQTSLASGMPLSAARFDDVFSGLVFDRGVCVTRIEDAASGRTVTQVFDDAFRECVVYNPPHREAVCIEPYTCVPNFLELAERGIDSGGRTLPPGERFEAHMKIQVECQVE